MLILVIYFPIAYIPSPTDFIIIIIIIIITIIIMCC
jgi:hypothetical protein